MEELVETGEALVLIGGLYMLLVVYLWFLLLRFRKRSQRLQNLLDRYVSPMVREQLIKRKRKEIQLGGEQRLMTVLFSDIRGFTALSETFTPYELSLKINEYLDVMSKVIIEHGGVIDKYIGDAIMAFWPGPPGNESHQVQAVSTALAMRTKLAQIQQNNLHFADLQIGIGLNTGQMFVGNIGSQERFDHTVIGDNVNVASRLEGLTKAYGVNVLLSESVKESIPTDQFVFRLVDEVIVKGKSIPLKIYEPLDNNKQSLVINELYAQGFFYYQKGQFEHATLLFEQIRNDPPAEALLRRMKQEKIDRHKWNGIWEWAVK